jgi:hypothetical protein
MAHKIKKKKKIFAFTAHQFLEKFGFTAHQFFIKKTTICLYGAPTFKKVCLYGAPIFYVKKNFLPLRRTNF